MGGLAGCRKNRGETCASEACLLHLPLRNNNGMTSEQTNALSTFSDALADAVETAGSSIVAVNARRRLPATGVAWDATTVLTSDHVIEREENITVTLPSGEEVPATIIGRDPGSDLAILRVSGAPLTPIVRTTGEARPGQLAFAVGRPGNGVMASFGVVSYVGGPWRTFRGAQVSGYLRSDTTFFPGFSGGPLIDTQGRMLGLNSSRLGQGQGMTVPNAAIEKVVTALLAGGRIRRGYLGISSQVVRLPEKLAADASGQESGLLIVGVESDSPAGKAGLIMGDILAGISGTPVKSTEDLQSALGPETVGQVITVSVFRGGALTAVPVTVGERE